MATKYLMRKKKTFRTLDIRVRSIIGEAEAERMDALQSHRVETLSIAVALVAIGAATAYYFYVTKKKSKGLPLFPLLIKLHLSLSLSQLRCF